MWRAIAIFKVNHKPKFWTHMRLQAAVSATTKKRLALKAVQGLKQGKAGVEVSPA